MFCRWWSEVWALNTTAAETLAVAQHKIARIMFGITLRDRKSKTWIRQQMGVKDIIETFKKDKGHISCLSGQLERTLMQWQRTRGWPKTRWRGGLTQYFRSIWPSMADYKKWCRLTREGTLPQERKGPGFGSRFGNRNKIIKVSLWKT